MMSNGGKLNRSCLSSMLRSVFLYHPCVSVHYGCGARVRELDFDLTALPVSTRTAKGLTVTKWTVKDVTAAK